MTESIKTICRAIRREGFAQILVDGEPWEIDVDPLDRDKPTVIALREIEAGKVGLEMLNRGQA